jgi:hypothetical protein
MSSSSFQLTDRLRDGYASTVFRCNNTRLNQIVVVKFIANVTDAKDEVKTIGRFCHPNVINTVDFIKWTGSFGIVMHAMDMDLRHFMESEEYDSVTVCEITRQCARGLNHVHLKQTLHADVKPENFGISITKRAGKQLAVHIRLLDFGSSKLLTDIISGLQIRSTLHYQSPEKRLGVFHLPGDIYELGIVFQEIIQCSSAPGDVYDELIKDMLQVDFLLRPTSEQVLARLGDPLHSLWVRLSRMAAGSCEAAELSDLVESTDPLTFLWRDLLPRMQYIVKLGDTLIERAFYLLFKTAQSEISEFSNNGPTVTILQYVHQFHATVDTSWWTQLFYCMAVNILSALPYFSLSDIMKAKLLALSGIGICEPYVRGVFLNYKG